jgi:hypothetical protein
VVTSGALGGGGGGDGGGGDGGGGGCGGAGGGDDIVRAKDAEWLMLPLVPVNTIVAVAVAAVGEAASITLCGCPADSIRDAGVAVTPTGSPLTETATVPLNEFTAAAETLTCAPAPPAWIVTAPGDADNEKSGLAVVVVLVFFDVFDPHESSSIAPPRQVTPTRSRVRRSRIEGPSVEKLAIDNFTRMHRGGAEIFNRRSDGTPKAGVCSRRYFRQNRFC